MNQVYLQDIPPTRLSFFTYHWDVWDPINLKKDEQDEVGISSEYTQSFILSSEPKGNYSEKPFFCNEL